MGKEVRVEAETQEEEVLATFWKQATPGVTYYRATLPARHMPGQVLKLVEADAVLAGEEILFPRQKGVAIWSFPGNNVRALLIAEMQNQGIPCLAEFDDNYRVPPPFVEISNWRETRDRADVREYDMHTYQTATDVCRFVDGLIVSTPYLADIYSELNDNIHVCPNCVDPDDWDPDPPHQADGILRVGWAASDSHKYDAPLIKDALAWASSRKGVEVVVMGIHPEISRFRFPYRHIPWSNSLADYRKAVSVLDVMLCPVIPSEWTNAKSDVKAMEAAMGGACSIVSETEPYRPWFDKPAYVAKQPWDYTRLLKHLVRNRDEVAETARLAREYVLAERDIRQHVHKWRDACLSQSYTAAELLTVSTRGTLTSSGKQTD